MGGRTHIFEVDNVGLAISMLRGKTLIGLVHTDALIMSPSMYEVETRANSAEVLRVARNVGVGSIAFITGLGVSRFRGLGVGAIFDKGKMSEEAEKEKIREFLRGVKSW